MSWPIIGLLILVVLLVGGNIALAVTFRRRWVPVVRRQWTQARQQWLHLPKRQKRTPRRQSQTGPFADMRTLWAKIAEVKAFLEPKTQGVQLTPLALMLELQALEKGLQHLALEERIGGSDVLFYGGWMKVLEKSIRSHAWLTIEPTQREKLMREQTYALLGNLLKRLKQLGEPASSDANSVLASGAIALLGIQNQDVKVSATMCLDYARFVERKVQELEAKYGQSAPSMQTRSMRETSAPLPEMPGQQPLVRRPVLGVRPTLPPERPSTVVAVPAQGEPTLRFASQVPETTPRAETSEQQPLVRRLASTQMPRVTASGEASSAGRDPQQPPVRRTYPRTSSF